MILFLEITPPPPRIALKLLNLPLTQVHRNQVLTTMRKLPNYKSNYMDKAELKNDTTVIRYPVSTCRSLHS
jgi:hypothetical protein